VRIGTLVKEKEGRRFGGVIVKSKEVDTLSRKRTEVLVQWSDGVAKTYYSTFLEEISPNMK